MQGLRSFLRAASVAACVWLAACAQPIAPARLAYVGEWRGKDMALVITAEGQVHYLKVSGNSRKSIDAPLKEFVGDDFIVGVGPFSTRFTVSSPPHRECNVWKMTVDGVEMARGLGPADADA